MNSFDRFTSPEMLSLNDTYAVKILICYFLRQINRPITPLQLTEIATADGTVNYFLFSEVIEQMLSSGMLSLVDIDGEEYYSLSESAKSGADDFKKLVPKVFRNRILSSGLKFFARLKNDNDVKVTITEHGKGYFVGCTCKDGDYTLMDLRLYAPDLEQANMLADKIKLNPADFYGKVIDFALGNEEYKPETVEVDEL